MIAQPSMHAILASVGTAGDVYPFVGLGMRLRARGHRVTLAANEHYRDLAAHHKFAFRALVSDEETHELLVNPDVWRPLKNAIIVARWARRAIGRQYALLRELACNDDAVLVAYPPVLAARLVQEKLSCPMASIASMPWMIPSEIAPSALPGVFNPPRWAPRRAVKLYWRLLEAYADVLVAGHLNRTRRSLDLKPVRRVVRWAFSPHLTIAMFPEWYAPPQPDWPVRTRAAGFSMFDGAREGCSPRHCLDFCRDGPPPLAFTFGTGMMHGTRLFGAAVQACESLGARGIFFTKFEEHLPAALPSFIHHCRYAPFAQIFPHCAAVVHHGGVGTMAQALAAATPQLILPMAVDQRDNATRVKRLRVGDWLPPKSSGRRIAASLAALMTPSTQARCREVADTFGNDDPLDTAAQWIEELAQRHAAAGTH